MKNSAALVMLAAAAVTSCQPSMHGDPYADAPPYAKALDRTTTSIKPFLTAGQRIPLTDSAGRGYLVVGIPDGLGLYRKGEHVILMSSHEFRHNQGRRAGPLPGGARVSEFTLSIRQLSAESEIVVTSGKLAIDHVYEADTLVTDTTRRFGKLCSATLADQRVGFDRPMFITSEELDSASTFDRRGGQAFAVFGGNAYALPSLGRFRGENRVPVRVTDTLKTVVFGLEDDERRASHLYMYVGQKPPMDQRKNLDALSINGLKEGDLYVFAADSAGESRHNRKGTVFLGHWEPVHRAFLGAVRPDSALEAAARAAGAFKFVRVEDGAARPGKPGEFWFVTTGAKGNVDNPFGRLYRLNFDADDPAGRAKLKLTLEFAGDTTTVGDTASFVSPDNIDINQNDELAICEDPNYDLKADLRLGRDTYFWVYNIETGILTAVAELDREAARFHALAADSGNSSVPGIDHPGGWEFSGVVDAEEYLGRGAWILDVQAHSLRIAPKDTTVEGGQYLQVIWKPPPGGSGSDRRR